MVPLIKVINMKKLKIKLNKAANRKGKICIKFNVVVNKKDPTLKQNGGWGEREKSLCVLKSTHCLHQRGLSRGKRSGREKKERTRQRYSEWEKKSAQHETDQRLWSGERETRGSSNYGLHPLKRETEDGGNVKTSPIHWILGLPLR